MADPDYRIELLRSAVDEIEALPTHRERMRLLRRIKSLSTNPRPNRFEIIEGNHRCRLRQGFYRILYEVREADRVVRIVRVRKRGEPSLPY